LGEPRAHGPGQCIARLRGQRPPRSPPPCGTRSTAKRSATYVRHAGTRPAGILVEDADDFDPISIAASPRMKARRATGTDGARATSASAARMPTHPVIGQRSFRLIRDTARTASTTRASARRSVKESGPSWPSRLSSATATASVVAMTAARADRVRPALSIGSPIMPMFPSTESMPSRCTRASLLRGGRAAPAVAATSLANARSRRPLGSQQYLGPGERRAGGHGPIQSKSGIRLTEAAR
jgi:hypothetical protein